MKNKKIKQKNIKTLSFIIWGWVYVPVILLNGLSVLDFKHGEGTEDYTKDLRDYH